MPKRGQKTQNDFHHTWYAVEWLTYFGKSQADLIRDLGYSRAKASDVWNGQPYRQELVDDLAPYLNLEPYEMLLAPDQAMALRQYRASAVQLAKGVEESNLPTNVHPIGRKVS